MVLSPPPQISNYKINIHYVDFIKIYGRYLIPTTHQLYVKPKFHLIDQTNGRPSNGKIQDSSVYVSLFVVLSSLG